MSNLKKFIRDEVLDFKEYKTVPSVWDLAKKFNKPENEIIKLDQGENLFGDSKKISKALGNYNFYNYYPDPEYKKLRKAIGDYLNVSPQKIMVGSGSDELIDLIFRLTINIGDEVVNFPPTFGMYDVSLTLNRGKVINVPRNDDFSINIQKALKAINKNTKIIIVCSPNNPTGNPTSKSDVIKLLETGKLVLLDEAYAEYAKEDFINLAKKYDNLIILRTFSKWAGIAGLRLGYAIMNEYFVSQLMKIKPPFNVNLAAEVAGIEILKNITPYKKNINALKTERERLSNSLNTLPFFKVFPSQTNFVYVKYTGKDFDKFRRFLVENEVSLRFFVSELTENAIRITVGKKRINDRLIKILSSYKENLLNPDGIIFDMDGVLIDESNSCRLSIIKTVNYFLKKGGLKTSITKKEVDQIKSLPGFNDDIDSTFAILELVKNNRPLIEYSKYAKPLTESVKKSKDYQTIYDVWQTYYLGSELFKRIEKRYPVWESEKGLIYNETLLISKEVLKKLSKSFPLAIATGRPKLEAQFAVNYFGLTKFFGESVIIGKEDTPFTKPDPSPLLEAKKRINSKQPIYVGDTINDVIAAKKAGMKSVFVGQSLGDYQIKNVNELIGELL